ncbi:MAG: CHAT domain-containing protein [Pseudomonadota bacterium]
MTEQLRFNGVRIENAQSTLGGEAFATEVRLGVHPGSSRSQTQLLTETVDSNDLVELDFGQGLTLWMSVEQYLEDTRSLAAGTRGGDATPLGYPRLSDDSQRGLASWALKSLKVLGIDPRQEAIDFAGEGISQFIAELIERKLHRGGGLYHFDGSALVDGAIELGDKNRALVLLHGTFSSTPDSFKDLGGKPNVAWSALQQKYGADRILGFDHESLTKSPIDNALDLVKSLPEGATLDLVSHSRGGLVGDVLTLASDAELRQGFLKQYGYAFFEAAGQPDQRVALTQLAQELDARAISVDRFVRIASPTRGTTLMSGRLDLWLSCVVSVMKKLGLEASDLFSIVSDVLLATIKSRRNPEALPGLAAMQPSSALVRLINSAPGTNAQLSVVAGNYEGGGFLGHIGEFVSDRFFDGDNDFVVPTPSMLAPAGRWPNAQTRRVNDSNISHFSYFRHQSGIDAIHRGLVEPPAESSESTSRGIAKFGSGDMVGSDDKPLDARKPTVIVLPGIMGSGLSIEDEDETKEKERVWADISCLVGGGLKKIKHGSKNVVPDGFHQGSYKEVAEYFSRKYNCELFPYDWRLSVFDAAEHLAARLDQILEKTSGPVYLLAHSMGGLVARALISAHPAIWQQIIGRSGRLVMAGTPNAGSYSAVENVLGRSKSLRRLAFLDFKHSLREVRTIVAGFPGFLELLPVDSQADHFSREIWQTLQPDLDERVVPARKKLRAARASHDRMKNVLTDQEHIKYVAGIAKKTPAGVSIDGGRLRRDTSREGDGTVLWQGGIPDGISAWYLDAEHGELLNHESAFGAYEDLLTQGSTQKLPSAPPLRKARSADGTPEAIESEWLIEEDEAEFFPDEDDLTTDFLSVAKDGPTTQSVDVEVVHGDLQYAAYPVLIGHYKDDGIYSAEAALNHRLQNRLSNRLDMGDYPGEIGSTAIVLNEEDKKAETSGAVVIGLGQVGSLDTAALVAAIDQGIRTYATRCAEMGIQNLDRGLGLSALLVGSSEGGVGSSESVRCLLDGLTLANQKIDEFNRSGADPTAARISKVRKLQIVEIYEDRAIASLQRLLGITEEFHALGNLNLNRQLKEAQGRLRRIGYASRDLWWARFMIEQERDAGKEHKRHTSDASLDFRFTAMVDTARAPEDSIPNHRLSIEDLLHKAFLGGIQATRERQALFELLLPNAYKQAAAEERNILLVLDEPAASLPWELFLDRTRDRRLGDGPGNSGLLRTLKELDPPSVAYPSTPTALVWGDPTPAQDPQFSQLDGAKREAEAVDRALSAHDWTIASRRIRGQDDVSNTALLSDLFAEDYRILHFAGHGVFDANDPKRSGMVIGETSGSDWETLNANRKLLTPNMIRQMRYMPELVFINCCFSGTISDQPGTVPRESQRDRHRLAGSLATQFIKMGVKAVVATGWEVSDAAAERFADVFYRTLLPGGTFGEAVTAARRAAYASDPMSNTWAAYQCYGSPQFRIRASGSGSGDRGQQPSYVSPAEPLTELQNLSSRIKSWGPQDDTSFIVSVQDSLEAIDARIPGDWDKRADLMVARGDVLGEAKLFAEALAQYNKALASQEGQQNVPFAVIETRANIRSRLAEQQFLAQSEKGRVSRKDRSQFTTEVKASIAELEWLQTLGETSERHALIGSAYKSLLVMQRRPIARDLKAMTAAYDASQRSDNAEGYYGAMNALLGESLSGSTTTKPLHLTAERSAELHSLIEARADKPLGGNLDWWGKNARFDFKFVDAIYRIHIGEVATKAAIRDLAEAFIQEYQDFLNSSPPSAKAFNSVQRTFQFAHHLAESKDLKCLPFTRAVLEAFA